MTRSPVIGITTYSRSEAGEFYLPGAYVDAVVTAGGTPILLPPNQPQPARILDFVDGLVFSGGGDINPELYGGSLHPTIYLVDEERDEFELALAKAVIAAPIPTLGICRGMQLLSVASGAKLITHIPDEYGETVMHRLDHPRRPIDHEVQVQPKSQLANLLGQDTVSVVSWHHQAIKAVPEGWQVSASAADGLIEALERPGQWMMAVQWHPEMSPQDPVQQRLFQGLVEAAAQKMPALNLNR